MLVFDAFIPPPHARSWDGRGCGRRARSVCSASLSECARSRERRGARAVILAHAAGATDGEAFSKLAKFLIFPLLAAAVLSKRQAALPQVRNVVVASGLAALTVHLVIVTAGLGERGYRYGVGEKIGFGPEIPHELALLAVVMAAAGLSMTERVLQRAALFALGVLPALLTGVRSALVGIALILVVMLYQSRLSGRSLAVVALVAAVALGTGAQAALTERLSADVEGGATLTGVSNERSDIWAAALGSWWDPGPGTWLVGTGPASIPDVVQTELGACSSATATSSRSWSSSGPSPWWRGCCSGSRCSEAGSTRCC